MQVAVISLQAFYRELTDEEAEFADQGEFDFDHPSWLRHRICNDNDNKPSYTLYWNNNVLFSFSKNMQAHLISHSSKKPLGASLQDTRLISHPTIPRHGKGEHGTFIVSTSLAVNG